MQCPCGGMTEFRSHVVVTKAGKMKWMGEVYPNPVRVDRDVCESCGRQQAKFKDETT